MKSKFLQRFLALFNAVLLLLQLFAMGVFGYAWEYPLFTLSVPLLSLVNLLFFIFWAMKLRWPALLFVMAFLLSFQEWGKLYQWPNNSIPTDKGLHVMSFNVRTFNRFRWIDRDDIPKAVESGEVDVGLVIHETQLSYEQEGNVKILDVGEWWDKTTGGLPVPLGINVMKTDLGMETIVKFDKYLQASIEFGIKNFDDALEYAMQYSRGKERGLIEKFVKMYVNQVTVNMGDPGERAIRKLFEMAKEKGLVPDFEISIATK